MFTQWNVQSEAESKTTQDRTSIPIPVFDSSFLDFFPLISFFVIHHFCRKTSKSSSKGRKKTRRILEFLFSANILVFLFKLKVVKK